MPGISELPLLGQSGGLGYPGLRSFFRRKGVVGGFWFPEYDKTEEEKQASIAASYHPWGMDSACGVFLPTIQRLPEELDTDSFFAESKGADGTIWISKLCCVLV